MKNLLIILTLACCSLFAQEKNSGSINLEITGFDSNEGTVKIALFNSYESYTKTGKTFKTADVKIVGNKAKVSFENIPYGEYAVTLFHDENDNNEFDTGLFGIPTEGYAFSNNATGIMGPASYEDAKFNLNQETVKQKLTIN